MNRIFKTSEVDDIISTDQEIIKSVLTLIDDIKKIASESSSDASKVPSEAKKGDVSGTAATIRSSIDSEAYSNAKSKLTCVEKNLKGIKVMDQTFAKELEKLSQSTNKIRGIIKELDEFLHNTPLTTPATDYNAALSAKMAVWEKVLKGVDLEVDVIKKMAKGAELFSSVFSADPVNLSTGNFIYDKTDIEYGGSDGLCFKRFYNSVNDYEGMLGKDWITNYEVRLSFIDSRVYDKKEISIIKEDGKEELFLPVDEKRYTPQANSFAELWVIDNGYEYKKLDGSRYLFDKEGFLERVEDSNGLGYNLEYLQVESIIKNNETTDDHKLKKDKRILQKVMKDSGECFVFTYSEDGYLKSVTDSEKRIVSYEMENGKLVLVTRPDGTLLKYTYSVAGKLRAIENSRSIITVENEYDQEYRVIKQHFPDGTSMLYDYDDENGVITQTERNGAVTLHFHDEQMRNVKNVYPDGEESFKYNSRGQKIQIKDKNGNVTKLSYDNRGNCTGLINPLGTKVSITYNNLNKPIKASVDGKEKRRSGYDEKGNLLYTIDSLGRKTVLKYDDNGRLIRIIAPDGSFSEICYDLRGNVIEIKDAQKNVTKYGYDSLNRVIEVIEPSGAKRCFKYDVMNNIIEEQNSEGNIRKYKYNESGKIIEIKDYDGNLLKRTYNKLNKLEVVTDKQGRETRLQYDAMWNLARVISPDGGQTTYIYNENNRLTRIKDALGNTTRFTYDGMGNRLSSEDEEGNITTFDYDAVGRIICVKDSEGYETNYEYDNEGNLIKITDKAGNQLVRVVDTEGQVVEERIIAASSAKESEVLLDNQVGDSAQELVRKYTYDLLGNVKSVTTETGIITRYEYLPGTNKISEIIYNSGNKESFSYNENGYLTSKTDVNGLTITYKYNSMNKIVEVIGPDGESKKYTYDVMGNVSSMTDVLGNTTRYEYSPSGKMIKVVDALGGVIEYLYDVNDRLIGVKQRGINGETQRLTKYIRNLLGNIEEIIDPAGQKESFLYNKRGELIRKIDKEGYVTNYSYTGRGDVESVQYADGREVMLSYDSMRRLTEIKDWLGITKVSNDSLGRTTDIVFPDNKKVSYMYNSLNQKTEILYPDGQKARYLYNEDARLKEIVVLSEGNEKISGIVYTYNKQGRIQSKTFSNGTETQYDYNEGGLLSKLVHIDKEGILDEYKYSYDKVNNKTKIIKKRRGLISESGIYDYEYDAVGRLKSVSKNGALLHKYSYDIFGNRILFEEKLGDETEVTRYFYDESNQLTEKTRYNSVNNVIDRETYNYDKRGNLTEILSNDCLKNKYIYGSINRLEETVNEFGESAKYIYDGLGHRVSKKVFDFSKNDKMRKLRSRVDYIVDFTREYNNTLERIQNNLGDATVEKYVWDGNIAERIVDNKSDCYLKDELGSTIRLISENGDLEESYGYDEFGNDLYNNQGIKQPFGFVGYQIDSVSNTYFAQAREYCPEIGRFGGRDVFNGYMDLPVTNNAYSYCLMNPINIIDPSGNTYIIGWSYSIDEAKKFEQWYYNCINCNVSITVDGDTSDWDQNMWDEFDKRNSFARAANTKRNELIANGVDPNEIVVERIDDGDDFKSDWEKWTELDSVQELHIYSHGTPGKPEVKGGTFGSISDTSEYGKLNWKSDYKTLIPGAYFYGCHTAMGSGLQTFADNQGVDTYGNQFSASFSSNRNKLERIINYSTEGDVYLGVYGVFSEDFKGIFESHVFGFFVGRVHISMIHFSPNINCND